MKQGTSLPDVPAEMIRFAAIASAGGAAEWEQLSERARQVALADCEVIVRSAFAALDVEAICASYYARTGRSIDRAHLQAVLAAWGEPDSVGATASLGEDNSSDAASAEIRRLRAALKSIATQGPNYGPDGTRNTWRHWADIAREALADELSLASSARGNERSS
ncbi:hypothetical protein [Xanthomonas sacchari]|uniref:hypothetical protein n=1 Tax=Xanthomonas sacchari TaxID=56458 RepID=UPI00225E5265|nr:hypothetical protein [Xanthomonas sacchari]